MSAWVTVTFSEDRRLSGTQQALGKDQILNLFIRYLLSIYVWGREMGTHRWVGLVLALVEPSPVRTRGTQTQKDHIV